MKEHRLIKPAAARAAGAAESPWNPSRERERSRAIKREAVILAAARAFRERGYHNTSLDDVAAALNVTKPTIYYYVANKEEILFECFRAGLDEIKAVFDQLGDAKRPARERVRALPEQERLDAAKRDFASYLQDLAYQCG